MSANGLHRIRWRWVDVERVHWTAACQFARDLVYIQQTIVERGVPVFRFMSVISRFRGVSSGLQIYVCNLLDN